MSLELCILASGSMGNCSRRQVLSAKRQTRRAHGAEEKIRICAAFATIAGVGVLYLASA